MKQIINKESAIIITGCSSGLGLATAFYLKEHKFRVFATARSINDVEKLRKSGFESCVLDLDKSESIDLAVKHIAGKTDGKIYAVVQNGGYAAIGSVEDLDRNIIRAQFETNVFGAIELTGKVMPFMRKQGAGKVIFISSVNGRFTFPYLGAYCASKHAIESFADALRREQNRSGIKVSIIEPGVFRTRSVENAICRLKESGLALSGIDAQKYKRLTGYLERVSDTRNEKDNRMVAGSVLRILEAKHPPARIIVPWQSLIYECMHRFLPHLMQDAILRWRMGFLWR
jgi:NAD(P)-dependent dehydrogenase (short-subunit alcohol dehydrogenase family)